VQGAKAPKAESDAQAAGSRENPMPPMPTDPDNRPWTPKVVPGRFGNEGLAENLAAAVAEAAREAAALANEASERAAESQSLQVKLAKTRIDGLIAQSNGKIDQLDQLAQRLDALSESVHERANAGADEALARVDEALAQLDAIVNGTLEEARESFERLHGYAQVVRQASDDARASADETLARTVGDIREYAANVARQAAKLRIEADNVAHLAEDLARTDAPSQS